MALWLVSDDGPVTLPKTRLEGVILEENLEHWIAENPSLLGEPLLIIGRRVTVPDLGDELDLLALDPQGAAVVIEVKRGQLKDPAEFQALRYASYISKWSYEDFEREAARYYDPSEVGEFSLNEKLEEFGLEAGTDEVPDLNEDQRIILVGARVRDRLGSVALWLREHGVELQLIEVEAYESDLGLVIRPNVVVPVQASEFVDVGKRGGEVKPWQKNGRSWHLDERCSPQTRDRILFVDNLLQESFDLQGPRWGQKHYVSYRVNNLIWLKIITNPKTLRLDIIVEASSFDGDSVASELCIELFDEDATRSEKINLPSSIKLTSRTDATDKIQLRIKEDFDLESDAFLTFLKRAYQACPSK